MVTQCTVNNARVINSALTFKIFVDPAPLNFLTLFGTHLLCVSSRRYSRVKFASTYLYQSATTMCKCTRKAFSDGGGVTRPWILRSSHASLIMKFSTNKLGCMDYIPAKLRDSSSRISWFGYRRFHPPARPPGIYHSAIYHYIASLMRSKIQTIIGLNFKAMWTVCKIESVKCFASIQKCA